MPNTPIMVGAGCTGNCLYSVYLHVLSEQTLCTYINIIYCLGEGFFSNYKTVFPNKFIPNKRSVI